ncbi:hypothetical protein ACHHRT_12465 [Desulfurivibrio sp. D14AmB]|uniref:hypothetical protein n=1 Tax=Desulfurivibrio sp. D14AmB TaxID=3374370 RepID=UPI00376F357F
MKRGWWLLMIVFLFAFSGCLSSDSVFTREAPDASQNDISVSINHFGITGTADPVNGVVPINPGVDDGSFTVSWDVSSNVSVYHIELFVSKDGSIGDEAISFFAQNCGVSPICGQTGVVECRFTTDNQISCGDNIGANLTDFLDQLPQELFIVMRTLSSLFSLTFEYETVKVQLQ